MTKFERYTVHTGLSLIAGWCSLAVFLNWTPQIVTGLENFKITPEMTCIALLIVICGWVQHIALKSNGNGAYIFPVLWGLSFLFIGLLIDSKTLDAVVLRNMIAPAGIIFLVPPFFKKYDKPVSTKLFSKP